jgi:hypothetical protein
MRGSARPESGDLDKPRTPPARRLLSHFGQGPSTRSITMNAQTPAASNDFHDDDALSRMLDEGCPHGD